MGRVGRWPGYFGYRRPAADADAELGCCIPDLFTNDIPGERPLSLGGSGLSEDWRDQCCLRITCIMAEEGPVCPVISKL
jgi:hypothetical protein